MLLGEVTLFFSVFFLFEWWKYTLVLAILQDLTLPNIFRSHFLHIFSDIRQFSLHISFIFHPMSSLYAPDRLSEVIAHLVRNWVLYYERFFHMFEAGIFTAHSHRFFLKVILELPVVFTIYFFLNVNFWFIYAKLLLMLHWFLKNGTRVVSYLETSLSWSTIS